MARRYIVMWEAFLSNRYLQEFLPGGVPRWTKDKARARLYADADVAEKAAISARTTMKKMGISVDVGSITAIIRERSL